MNKLRTQIQLDPSDYTAIKSFAARQGISMAAAIRMLIRQALGEGDKPSAAQWEAFLRLAGSGHDREGRKDVARHHDRYLYELDW